jgi:hypothetical protein
MPESRGQSRTFRLGADRLYVGGRSKVSLTYLLLLALAHMAYCGYYWTVLTARLIVAAREKRMKQHLDWTAPSRRLSSRSTGWKLW